MPAASLLDAVACQKKAPLMDLIAIAEKYALRALGVIGSRARGDHSRHSDLDLVGLGSQTDFRRFRESSILAELHIVRDVAEWASRPSWWYALREVKVVIDDGTLSTLPSLVEEWRRDYRVPLEEVRRNRGWLESMMRKLRGAESPLDAAFLLNTNTWEILAGAFLARSMPVPASSHMLRLAPRVVGEERFRILMMGAQDERVRVALEVCSEVVEAHKRTLAPSGDCVGVCCDT